MNDQSSTAPADTAVTSPRGRHRLWPWIVLLVILVLLVAAGFGGWRGWQWYQGTLQAYSAQQHALQTGVAQARSQADALRANLAAVTAATRQSHAQVQALQSQVTAMQNTLDALDASVNGGRRAVQVAIVEQLLLTANDQVQLAHDPATALKALDAADERLAVLNDPRFFAVRRAIAKDKAALAAVHEPDFAGTAITLGGLIDDIGQLPFRGAPRALAAPQATPASSTSAWVRGWERVGRSLAALFRVRHQQQPVAPLLPESEQQLVGAVLALRLDGARAALVRRDTAVYHAELQSAASWVARYYRGDDPVTLALHDELTKLAAIDLAPALPDISDSLDLLRKQLTTAPGA
ncbi:MAG TPA: uroporphyrinogen-III C-methyltransferase [Nevskiaceae bacterium]|nr:uroporphyrinogen-III C-methyltransferase [Nevskiaceae bacterium]